MRGEEELKRKLTADAQQLSDKKKYLHRARRIREFAERSQKKTQKT